MKRWQAGFTIIEVVLFLAITGLLIVGLLAGVNSALQQQQYRDTVQSFANFLRDQYARVISVENDRENQTHCPVAGSDTRVTDRGQSNCVIVGRYVVSTNAQSYRSYPLYAVKQGEAWKYGYNENEASDYTVGWGAQIRFLTSANSLSRVMALAMYRSPTDGQLVVRTHEEGYSPANISNFINDRQPNGNEAVNSQLQQREFCVYDAGWSAGQRLSVFVAAKAGSSEAITTGNATKGCDNERTA